MFFNSQTNTYVGPRQSFTIGDTQYPDNWLELASPEEIASIGLTPVNIVGTAGDPKYFENSEVLLNGCITITSTPIPLSILKARAWEQIKNERDRRIQSNGFLVDNKWFHSDTFSRTQQLGLVLLGDNIPAGLTWKTMDGTFIPMDKILAGKIFAEASISDILIFTAAETHRVKMEALSDVSTYDFSTGWPKGYGEH